MTNGARFDHIVIGGGTAGSVVAARLTEMGDRRVLVLEAGPLHTTPDIETIPPLGVFKLMNSVYDWRDQTVPQAELHGRQVSIGSGRVVGGGGAIAFMFWCRGAREDYDGWAQRGMTGWSWQDVLPSYKRLEDNERGASDLHGRGGPIGVSPPREVSPASMAFVAACLEHGLPLNTDFDSGQLIGAGIIDSSIKQGVRSSTRNFILPALERDNLTLETGVLVRRILIENRRAIGVEYIDETGRMATALSDSVILSAGALRSPQILMLSGIGPADHLTELGIEVVAHNAGVGANLQDHPTLPVIYPLARGKDWNDVLNDASLAQWVEHKTGPYAQIAEVAAYFRAGNAAGPPDFQVVPTRTDYFFQGRRAISCVMNLMTPASRGFVRLQSSDPTMAPLIDPRFLTEASDRDALVAGIREILKIGMLPAFRAYAGEQPFELTHDASSEHILDYIRRNISSHSHPAGSCRAGSDEQSVVDPQLRVHGIEGLRVIDNSVMPTLPRAPTHATAVMIGERGAELVMQAE